MEELVERELIVPDDIEDVWSSLAEPEWLGEDAKIDLREAGDVRAGERTGFVEEVEAPRRLAFWWSAPGEESTRVELELDETDAGTHDPRDRVATARHPRRPRPRDRVRRHVGRNRAGRGGRRHAGGRAAPDGGWTRRTPSSPHSRTGRAARSTRRSASAERRRRPISPVSFP